MARSKNTKATTGILRVIGGQWRSRKLQFTPVEGLRPTSDRVRETLFNWLSPVIEGAICADLFAGSGALGIEALSRGAKHCDFIDTSQTALTHIARNLELLGATHLGSCHRQTAQAFIANPRPPIDVLFIDPPFGKNLVDPLCDALNPCLAEQAWVYVETPRSHPAPICPDNWLLQRDKTTSEVAYRLFKVEH